MLIDKAARLLNYKIGLLTERDIRKLIEMMLRAGGISSNRRGIGDGAIKETLEPIERGVTSTSPRFEPSGS